MTHENDIWIFGYGSLMWRPDFDHVDDQMGLVEGYHRDLCMLSYVFRGTPEVPGLVMGLNPGGSCMGRVFRVESEHVETVLAYLHEREMINNIYQPTWVDVQLDDETQVKAYTFVGVKDHPQHVGHISREEKIAYVLQGVGQTGTSLEYLENTCAHLRKLGIHDETLEEILSLSQAQTVKNS